MRPEGRTASFLADMQEHAQFAVTFVAGSNRSESEADRRMQFAVVRALEIVGEAAKMIPDEIRAMAPNIPWKQITAMRDKLIHHYFGVDLEIVWLSVTKDVPVLVDEFTVLLAKLNTDSS